jgi:hypothetical protein
LNKNSKNLELELAKLILPTGVLEYFNISKLSSTEEELHIYLEELNILPKEYQSEIAQSKGFLPETIVEDFPIRGKSVFLHIKRRRWTLVESDKIIKRDWNIIAKGTRTTKEFASFLKELIRQQPC